MSRKLYIHVGPDKTGTTHLQHFLARNHETLLASGVCYPPNANTEAEEKGAVLSGNGFQLACQAKEGPVQILPYIPHETNLVSSEAFGALPLDVVGRVVSEAELHGVDVKIIYYVRAPLDRFVSGSIQWTKRSGGTNHPAEVIRGNMGGLRRMAAQDIKARIDEWAGAFGERMVFRHYHPQAYVGGSIITDFLSALGIADIGASIPNDRTNPSLGEMGLRLMIESNATTTAPLERRKMSDAIMASGATDYPVRIPRDLLDEATKEYADDLAILRQRLNIPLLTAYTDEIAGEPASFTEAEYEAFRAAVSATTA